MDWIDMLGDALSHIASLFSYHRTPRQIVGIYSAALAAFIIIGIGIALYLGVALDPFGWYVIVPAWLVCIAVSVYCFFTD